MASKVKETPVLSGRDADAFSRAIKANESRKVSTGDYERARETYERVTRASSRK